MKEQKHKMRCKRETLHERPFTKEAKIQPESFTGRDERWSESKNWILVGTASWKNSRWNGKSGYSVPHLEMGWSWQVTSINDNQPGQTFHETGNARKAWINLEVIKKNNLQKVLEQKNQHTQVSRNIDYCGSKRLDLKMNPSEDCL